MLVDAQMTIQGAQSTINLSCPRYARP